MRKMLIVFAVLLMAGTAMAQSSSIFFSEYIEGSSNNKAVEIYNNTTGTLDLSRVDIERWNNGACPPGGTIGYGATLEGMLPPGEVWTIANTAADPIILAIADDIVNTSFTWYNGDDVLLLFLDGVLVDSIGRLCEDPGSAWGTDPITTGEHTLVRKIDNCVGDTDPTDEYDPAVDYDGYDQNDFTFLGFHDSTCQPVGNEDSTWSGVKALYR